jgi:uncharacterized protein
VVSKTTVIYHRADFDGLFSAAVCMKFLPKDTRFIGWDFGDPLPHIQPGKLYIVDLPADCFIPDPEFDGRELVWIDHHKSSIDKFDPSIVGYRIDGVAACRLAYQWFACLDPKTCFASPGDLPLKDHYIHRDVKEPLALTLAGEYDVWDKSDHRAEKFQFGLTAINADEYTCGTLLGRDGDSQTEEIVAKGEAAMDWQQAFAVQVCEERSYIREWEGRTFCVLASCHARNSMWFPQEAIPKECDALMCWRYDGEMVSFSLYHAPGHEEHDLSQIAVKYGGGGHCGACGFALSLDDALPIIRGWTVSPPREEAS